ncbi:DUF3619 family protein [Rhodoferax sp. GW822-FHT02A01]|uniref:DUF3619 family protein n=1 Tax=Rhodoferax sp. GW822-FHT02A01 TaxID=3141537 RepID=UPI00315D2948
MNTQENRHTHAGTDALGKAIAARLTEGTDSLPHDITERLRAARMQAVAKRRLIGSQASAVEVLVSGGEAVLQLGGGEGSWWDRVAALLPLLALVVGLVSIAVMQDELRAREVAEVDTELLTDVLPPAAYTDPGFAQFLRAQQNN